MVAPKDPSFVRVEPGKNPPEVPNRMERRVDECSTRKTSIRIAPPALEFHRPKETKKRLTRLEKNGTIEPFAKNSSDEIVSALRAS